jgi:hypothetical protein
MARCSVADVRSKVFTTTTDLQLTAIIADVDNEVSTFVGTTDQSNPNLIQAVKWAARSATLRYMVTNGEMAASIETPGYRQQNTIDKHIEFYDNEKLKYIKLYKTSVFVIPGGRMGYKTVNNELI